MSDAEIVKAMEQGNVNLLYLCRTRCGSWEYYDAESRDWREASNLKDAIGKIYKDTP